MTLGLDHRVARGCPLARDRKYWIALFLIVGATVVMRKFGCDFACAFAVAFFARCDPPMKLTRCPAGSRP